ncbi:MAG TPA: hypothetical protein VIU12_02915, partial [Chryseolinea sp.]
MLSKKLLAVFSLTIGLGCTAVTLVWAESPPSPLKVKVVVVAMFEIGKDTGDKAAEFQLWHEREKLTKRYP